MTLERWREYRELRNKIMTPVRVHEINCILCGKWVACYDSLTQSRKDKATIYCTDHEPITKAQIRVIERELRA